MLWFDMSTWLSEVVEVLKSFHWPTREIHRLGPLWLRDLLHLCVALGNTLAPFLRSLHGLRDWMRATVSSKYCRCFSHYFLFISSLFIALYSQHVLKVILLFHLEQWLSALLTLRSFNTAPRVAVTPTIQLFHCYFIIVTVLLVWTVMWISDMQNICWDLQTVNWQLWNQTSNFWRQCDFLISILL